MFRVMCMHRRGKGFPTLHGKVARIRPTIPAWSLVLCGVIGDHLELATLRLKLNSSVYIEDIGFAARMILCGCVGSGGGNISWRVGGGPKKVKRIRHCKLTHALGLENDILGLETVSTYERPAVQWF